MPLRPAILLALYAIGASAQTSTVEFKVLAPGILEERLRLAHKDIAERAIRLKSLLNEIGCQQMHEQKVKGSKQANLICTCATEGAGPTKIIVGAHFDHAGGEGVIDNWTGAILLPSLEHFMREKPRKHVFEFVGFAAEEKAYGARAIT
jgi:hypothetical protein